MNTILVIIGVIALLGVIYYIAWKKGWINDRDGDLIPDEIEDAVEDVSKEVKRRAKNVKEELQDVVDAAKELGNQIGDVGKAIKGKKRQGRKPKK